MDNTQLTSSILPNENQQTSIENNLDMATQNTSIETQAENVTEANDVLTHHFNNPIIQADAIFQESAHLDVPQPVEQLEETTPPLAVETINEALALSKTDSEFVYSQTQTAISPEVQNLDLDNQSNETIVQPTISQSTKRPRLSMPQFYLRTDNLPTSRGFSPNDDLQIELINTPKEPSQAKTWFREARSLVRDFLFAAVTALLIVIFVVQPVKVEGTSMLPKLHNDERIFINKFIYQFETIKRGDIVVFWYPKNPSQSFIKRVIGVPGDEVRITNGKLYINNKHVPEPYLSPEYTSNVMPNRYWMVEEHHYFVMGDNRDASNDSRAWGLVPEKYIYGKAIFRYWPLDCAGSLE